MKKLKKKTKQFFWGEMYCKFAFHKHILIGVSAPLSSSRIHVFVSFFFLFSLYVISDQSILFFHLFLFLILFYFPYHVFLVYVQPLFSSQNSCRSSVIVKSLMITLLVAEAQPFHHCL